MRRFDEATSKNQNFAFETTLGGRTVANNILDAARHCDVVVWLCGLASPELHIEASGKWRRRSAPNRMISPTVGTLRPW